MIYKTVSSGTNSNEEPVAQKKSMQSALYLTFKPLCSTAVRDKNVCMYVYIKICNKKNTSSIMSQWTSAG